MGMGGEGYCYPPPEGQSPLLPDTLLPAPLVSLIFYTDPLLSGEFFFYGVGKKMTKCASKIQNSIILEKIKLWQKSMF